MKRTPYLLLAGLVFCGCLTASRAADGDVSAIDGPHSTLRVQVSRSGFLSAFGHDHEIEAPIDDGKVEVSATPSVVLRVDARKLQVLDPDVSAATRAEIQATMESPQVLDVSRFSEIQFHSTTVEARGNDHWTVKGDLTLHGQTRPTDVDVTLKDGLYSGSATLRQTQFDIKPVTVAGGTVKVKDEIKVQFKIALMK
jgi:polyisoprenoid-binding protein YceI